jgi:hypothetical protein
MDRKKSKENIIVLICKAFIKIIIPAIEAAVDAFTKHSTKK